MPALRPWRRSTSAMWTQRLLLLVAFSASAVYYLQPEIPFWSCSFLADHAVTDDMDTMYAEAWNKLSSNFSPQHESSSKWRLFYHLGGNGPWIPKLSGTIKNGHELPQGCIVDQAHMVR